MKLLLTSQGITTREIADALAELVGKSPYDTKIAVIPIARNVEPLRRGGYIQQYLDLWKNGFSLIDIVDPSAADVDWKGRLNNADVIYVAGGNTFHLLNQTRKTGLGKWLNDNKDKKVYVGVSAGTIMATPTIDVANMPPRDNNFVKLKDLSGMNWVNFEVEPHCNEARFAKVEAYAKKRPNPVYAIDDQTAIKVDGKKVEVISAGFWKLYD
jgi:dipeptidase E